jgi:hypothetical protein
MLRNDGLAVPWLKRRYWNVGGQVEGPMESRWPKANDLGYVAELGTKTASCHEGRSEEATEPAGTQH